MNCYQTNAIVLKRENIFEADRAYYLYAEDFGKVKAIAGSVRKINAKLAGHLEPFNLTWVELMTKRNGSLFITTALSYKNFLNHNSSPAKITLFLKMADFISKMLRGSQKDDILWNFILKSFTNADLVEANAEKFLNEFRNGLINLLGFGADFNEARYYLNDFGVV